MDDDVPLPVVDEKETLIIEQIAILHNFSTQDVTKYYNDMLERISNKTKYVICKGMNRQVLQEMCVSLPKIEADILLMYYCDRMSLTAISYKVNYSYDYVEELKAKAMKKIKSSQ